ncbi:hypothetical protein KGY79_13305 [Candidatus Bipolaricaulota bacterium]|nr:hypothetical protein [Candidatus Bipolaricaulota bacterium]
MDHYLKDIAEHDLEIHFEAQPSRTTSCHTGDNGRRHYRKVLGHLQDLGKLRLTEKLRENPNFLKEGNSPLPNF